MMQQLRSSSRTQGDGMENVLPSEMARSMDVKARPSRSIHLLGDKLIYRPAADDSRYSPAPPIITGKVIHLVPKSVAQSRKERKILESLKLKEPKFVPYEPYKAAIKPMVPPDRKGRVERKRSGLAASLASLCLEGTSEPSAPATNPRSSKSEDVVKEWEEEKKGFQSELKTLKEENLQLESQLKFQAQVNGELKALLVAAVGEDMEVRVNHLTEDKLHLARALLSSAQRLSTHQEQTEWLAGHCEVWRSKFLASSLMVEELARWKAALQSASTELQEALKRLLEERRTLRDTLLHTYRIQFNDDSCTATVEDMAAYMVRVNVPQAPTIRNLSVLRENFEHAGGKRTQLCSSSVLDLSAANRTLSEVLTLQLLGGQDRRACREPDITGLDTTTWAEKAAEMLLASPTPLLLSDAACSAVLGAAIAVGGHGLPVSCCAHCSGEIKLV